MVVLPTASRGIGYRTDAVGKFRHFGDAARVVRDRAVGVDGDNDSGHGEHRNGGKSDCEKTAGGIAGKTAAKLIGPQDGAADYERRGGGGLHADRQAGDNVGSVAGGAGCGNVLNRVEALGGEVFGDHNDRAGQDETDERAGENAHCREAAGL